MSVTTSPGAAMFTRMPCPISSLAIVNASASSADLAMLYGAPLARMWATYDEIITMWPRPRPRIFGTTSGKAGGANVWVVMRRCISAGSVSATVSPARDAGVVDDDVDEAERGQCGVGERVGALQIPE